MLEHVEFAGVHSGDAAMVLPPHELSQSAIDTMREYTHAMAHELEVTGLMNAYAVKDEIVYVLEVNRARRGRFRLSVKPSVNHSPSSPRR